MTVKTCVVCGQIGHGVLVPCKHCGYRPQTGWEMGYSLLNSDHRQTVSSLEKLSREIRHRYNLSKPSWHTLSPSENHYVLSFLETPDGRDVLELRRDAKNGFFQSSSIFTSPAPTVTRREQSNAAKT